MKMTSYSNGTPCWVDLAAPDVGAATKFYGELFGWTAFVAPDQQFGGYAMMNQGDSAVAGIGPMMQPGQPSAWTTYLAVDDADATAAKITEAGGTVMAPPFDVGTVGRMAIFADPTGAVGGIWQKIDFFGAQVVNEPGTLSWNELATRDADRAKTFYTDAFGLTPTRSTTSGDTEYYELQAGGRPVAGLMPMTGPDFPPELPPHWLTYFAVADCDATVAKLTALGGTVAKAPTDIPPGRFSVVLDPNGAAFAVIALNPDFRM